jgi:nitrogen-specific signal transduction histidine kinase
MNPPAPAETLHPSKGVLLVCNAAGKVQAITSKATSDSLSGVSVAEIDFTESFGFGSTINRWLAEKMREAKEQVEYSAEVSLENGNSQVFVRLDSLRRDGELYGFALRFFPLNVPKTTCELDDGDSVVTRRQWHEIKNHVGALKLYATFLKRQMPDGDERRIVEKIFGCVNALIGYLDRIRRGEPQ